MAANNPNSSNSVPISEDSTKGTDPIEESSTGSKRGRKKGTGAKRGRPARDKEVPLIFAARLKPTCHQVKVYCERVDFDRYNHYVDYCFQSQGGGSLLSRQEIESRVNAMAWARLMAADKTYKELLEEIASQQQQSNSSES